MVVSSMSLSLAGNPNFVNTLPLYIFNIQFMYDNLNFSFLLWNKLHLYFVTFLLLASIYSPDTRTIMFSVLSKCTFRFKFVSLTNNINTGEGCSRYH